MSCSTPLLADPTRRAMLGLAACGMAGLWPSLARANHPSLPNGIESGSATLRFLGLQIYNARLWTPSDFDPSRLGDQPLVLELEYLRSFKGSAIADRSITEMRRAGSFSDDQARRWNAEMQRVFPDVRSGDRLTGIHRPGQGARFLFNDRPAGDIDDPAFSRLFFSIWLGPETSEPGMRRQLLARWL
jgi:hypothetical protein